MGWRGQREWREEIESLQYAALRKCIGAVLASRKTLVRGVAAVESVETVVRAAAGWFLAQSLCDLLLTGVAASDDPVLVGKGILSLGGACWHGVVEVADLGLSGEVMVVEWEEAIKSLRGGSSLLFTDGSHDESGRVGGGWLGYQGGSGSVAVGTVATV